MTESCFDRITYLATDRNPDHYRMQKTKALARLRCAATPCIIYRLNLGSGN